MIKLLRICCLVISDSGVLKPDETHYLNKKMNICRVHTD